MTDRRTFLEGVGFAASGPAYRTPSGSASIAPPMGLVTTAMVFGFFSLLLWLAVAGVIPRLHDSYGISPIVGWYLSGTVVVLVPILIFGTAMAWLELPRPHAE